MHLAARSEGRWSSARRPTNTKTEPFGSAGRNYTVNLRPLPLQVQSFLEYDLSVSLSIFIISLEFHFVKHFFYFFATFAVLPHEVSCQPRAVWFRAPRRHRTTFCLSRSLFSSLSIFIIALWFRFVKHFFYFFVRLLKGLFKLATKCFSSYKYIIALFFWFVNTFFIFYSARK